MYILSGGQEMNTVEFKEIMINFYSKKNDYSVSVYTYIDNSLFKLDIEASAQFNLRDLFLETLNNIIILDDEINLLPFSTADERKKLFYLYDLNEKPHEFIILEEIINKHDELPLFNFSVNNIDKISSVYILIGNAEENIILYKKLSQVNIFKRDNLFLIPHKTRLERINDSFLRITGTFQVLFIHGYIIIINLEIAEKVFKLDNVILSESKKAIQVIDSLDFLEDTEIFKSSLDNKDKKLARKLISAVKDSPVISSGIGISQIIKFCKTYPALKTIKFNDDETKIKITSKKSAGLFLNLLMDNFLSSELTKYHYESLAKNSVKPE